MKRVENDQVPRFMGAKKMSLHQTGFQEVISAAELTGCCPAEMLLIGVQPEELEDYGGSLRPIVKLRVAEAVDQAIAQLRTWGVEARSREERKDADLNVSALRMADYEAGRPSPDDACRIGDDRFLRIREGIE
jgi:hydrogenase maturation protease